jgi:hypothetical protein
VEGGTTLPVILNQWVEVRAEIDLGANVATIYYGVYQLASHQYYDPATGVAEVKAFDLYSDSSSESYMDNLWLDTTIPVELQSFGIE